MNKLIIIFLTVFQATLVVAQKNPKWVEKATKALITVETTSKDGIKKTGSGFFISEKGVAVSSYDLFKNSEKATITNSQGETMDVLYIEGVDALYGVVRFKVDVKNNISYLDIAQTDPDVNDNSYLLPSKQEIFSYGTIEEISKIKGTYNYYKINIPLSASQVNYPILNKEGKVFAMTQLDASGKGKTYGISIFFINSLKITASDIFNKDYSEIGIKKAWPEDIEEARLSLVLYASQQDANKYLSTLNDFISTFPENAQAYLNRASHLVYNYNVLEPDINKQQQVINYAEKDLMNYIEISDNKATAYYEIANLIYNIVVSDTLFTFNNWDISKAEEYLEKAIEANDNPAYHILEGNIAFNNQDFAKAFDSYSLVNNSIEATGYTYYMAAKSLLQIKGSNTFDIILLLDSAISKSPENESLSYILENIDLKTNLGLYPEAIKDFNKYYMLTGGNVNDAFYYYREQAYYRNDEFDKALKDIDRAISESKGENAIYFAEKASVCLKLQDLSKAQENAEMAINLQNDFASAYRILGVSFLRQDNKTEACKNFSKAKELGDEIVERLIKDNCKQL